MEIVRLFDGIDFDSQGDVGLGFINGPDFPPIQGYRDFLEFAAFPITTGLNLDFTGDRTTPLEFAGGLIQGAIACGMYLFWKNPLPC